MFGQGQLLNKRVNMKQYNYANAARDQLDDDDEEPIMSSFTKSKVDDDDEKFNKGHSDQEFLDALLRKKREAGKPPAESPSNIFESIRTGPSNPTTPPKSEKKIKSQTEQRTPSQKQVAQPQTPQIPGKQQDSNQKEIAVPKNQPVKPRMAESVMTPQQPKQDDSPMKEQKPAQTIPVQQPPVQQPYQTPSRKESSKTKERETEPNKRQEKEDIDSKKESRSNRPSGVKPTAEKEKEEPIKQGSNVKPTVVEPKQEPIRQESSSKKEPIKQESTSKKEPIKQESASKNEPIRQESSQKKEPIRQESASKQEPIRQESASKKEPIRQESSQKKETIKRDQIKKESTKQEAIKQELPLPKKDTEEIEQRKQVDIVEIEDIRDQVSRQLTTPQIGKVRPNFVRRGKNQPQIKELAQKMKGIPSQRIRAIEPRNYIEVSKELSLKFKPDTDFEDCIFPANLRQIFQVKRSITQDPIEFKRVNFGRPNDTISVVDPNDIQPGQYSNCLVNVLAAAAEQPNLFQIIFEDQKVNDQGFYYVRLFIDGVWKYIIVDDQIAMNNQIPAVCSPALDNRIKNLSKQAPGYDQELWSFLIEKGLAKVYGTYEDMISVNYVRDQLSEITGAPVFQTQIEESILNSLPKSFVSILELEEYPLVSYLGYDTNKKELILRNPWGWQDITPKSANAEGEFRLSISQCKNGLLNVAKHYDDYYWVSHGVRQSVDSYSMYEITISQQTHGFFTLYQKDERYFRNNLVKKYDYSFARVFLFNSDYELIGKASGEFKTLTIENNLNKGNYFLVVCLDWKFAYDCTVTYYGSSNIEMTRFFYKEDPNIFAALIGLEAIKQGKNTLSQNNVDEYWWHNTQDKLIVVTWRYNKDQPFSWKKDFSQLPNKDKWMPLSFINSKDKNKVMDMKTQDMLDSRNQSWWNAVQVDIDFPPNSYYSAVFKPI